MLILGIVLLIIGVGLTAYARTHPGEPFRLIDFIGWALALLGLVLVVLAIVDRADAAVLGMAAVGGGRPRGSRRLRAAGTRKAPPVIAGRPRPVLLAFLIGATPIVCTFILQVLEEVDALNSALWLRTLLTGLGGVVLALGTIWSQAQVTPIASPRDDRGHTLLPAPVSVNPPEVA